MQFYGNGDHSWVAIVAVLAVLAVRMVSTQRRRQGGRPGGPAPGPAPHVASPRRPLPSPDRSAGQPQAAPGFTGTAAGWFVDPFVRHEQRYWSGTAWTEHVIDGGTPAPSLDPTASAETRPR